MNKIIDKFSIIDKLSNCQAKQLDQYLHYRHYILEMLYCQFHI